MRITAPSDRYYADEMTGFEDVKAAVCVLSDIKIRGYSLYYRSTYAEELSLEDPLDGERLYKTLRDMRFNEKDEAGGERLGSIYANALEPYIKGILQSQVSQGKYQAGVLEDQISSMYDKINKKCAAYHKKAAVKEAIVRYAKTGEWITPYNKCSITISPDGILSGFRIKPQDYREYEFKVERDMKRLRASVSNIFEAILRMEERVRSLKEDPPRAAVFGSKALYKKKDTVYTTEEDLEDLETLEAWKQEFRRARHSSITLSGRSDSANGNFILKWDERTHDLVWKLPSGKEAVFRITCRATIRSGSLTR